jgi:hypothetical protein
MEYEMEKPSNKLLSVAGLDSDTWVAEVKLSGARNSR